MRVTFAAMGGVETDAAVALVDVDVGFSTSVIGESDPYDELQISVY